jgi:hypothetical protein
MLYIAYGSRKGEIPAWTRHGGYSGFPQAHHGTFDSCSSAVFGRAGNMDGLRKGCRYCQPDRGNRHTDVVYRKNSPGSYLSTIITCDFVVEPDFNLTI